MERPLYVDAALRVLTRQDVMLFLMGARQVGKQFNLNSLRKTTPGPFTSTGTMMTIGN